MTTRILTGHVMDKLADLPDESVHCCVTSPPYFGLRSYGTERQVWGGDRNCEHEWGAAQQQSMIGVKTRWTHNPESKRDQTPGEMIGSFCRHCAAWRGDLGLEPSPELYLAHLVEVFREVRRALRKDGTLWLNIGDSYAGYHGNKNVKVPTSATNGWTNGTNENLRASAANRNGLKSKDLIGIPWMLAFALRADGWWLRSEIIWAKKAPMPESVTDRPTSATEKVFLLTRSPRYFYDAVAVQEEAVRGDANAGSRNYRPSADAGRIEDGQAIDNFRTSRNMRNWWLLGPEPFPEAHFATFPTEIPRKAILAGTSERGVCPKCGAGWERQIERIDHGWDGQKYAERIGAGSGGVSHKSGSGSTLGSCHGKLTGKRETLGWRPTCSCEAKPPIPATVLDPFLGAGTTALVADQLGRDCVGIELNTEYAQMAERRLRDDAGMFAQVGE